MTIPWECPICLCDIFTAPGGEHQGRPICGTCWREAAFNSDYSPVRMRRLAHLKHQNATHHRAGRGQFITVRGHAKSQHQPCCKRCGRTDQLIIRNDAIVSMCRACNSAMLAAGKARR